MKDHVVVPREVEQSVASPLRQNPPVAHCSYPCGIVHVIGRESHALSPKGDLEEKMLRCLLCGLDRDAKTYLFLRTVLPMQDKRGKDDDHRVDGHTTYGKGMYTTTTDRNERQGQ